MLPWFNSELGREIRKRDRIRKTVKKHNKLLSTYKLCNNSPKIIYPLFKDQLFGERNSPGINS